MKICTKCQIEKPLSDFHKDKSNKRWGLTSQCKECITARVKASPNYNPDYRRQAKLKHYYNLTEEQYQAMYAQQNGVCKICKEKPIGTSLCIDHCHTSLAVRGLLCNPCNRGLGGFRDNPAFLAAAIEYLS